MASSSATPSFLDPILADALDQESSLLVMASGLGLHVVLQRLVEANSGPEHLVLLLNTTKEDEQQLLEQCAARGIAAPAIINNECPAQERMELYLSGGVLAVTQRILVVDLLCERMPAALATGVVVANAHRVTEGGNLAFILRIFRQLNRTAFIKALSDDPPALTKGFAQVEKVMRWLRVRKLQLWPRFHLSVSACLDATQPVVEECSVSLSGKAKELQVHVPPPTPDAPAGVEGPPGHPPTPWLHPPPLPCPTVSPLSYYYSTTTVLHYSYRRHKPVSITVYRRHKIKPYILAYHAHAHHPVAPPDDVSSCLCPSRSAALACASPVSR